MLNLSENHSPFLSRSLSCRKKNILFNLCTYSSCALLAGHLRSRIFLLLAGGHLQGDVIIFSFPIVPYHVQYCAKMPWEVKRRNNDVWWWQLFLSRSSITHSANTEWNSHSLPIVQCSYQLTIINFCRMSVNHALFPIPNCLWVSDHMSPPGLLY